MRVNMTPIVDFDELEMEFGKELNEYHFYASAGRKYGYFWLNLDEDAIPELDYFIDGTKEFAKDFGFEVDANIIKRAENQKELVNALRARGYTEDIIVYVFE